jgi:hypothetical protein
VSPFLEHEPADLPARARRRQRDENPCATVFRPVFTVFDGFSGLLDSKFARRIKRSTVFRQSRSR